MRTNANIDSSCICFAIFSVKPHLKKQIGVPKGIWTPVTAVKGRCPRPLDDGDTENCYPRTVALTSLVELCGIEPQTSSLPAKRSPSWAIAPTHYCHTLLGKPCCVLLSAGRILCSHLNNVNNFLCNFIQTPYFSTNCIIYKLSGVFFELLLLYRIWNWCLYLVLII